MQLIINIEKVKQGVLLSYGEGDNRSVMISSGDYNCEYEIKQFITYLIKEKIKELGECYFS